MAKSNIGLENWFDRNKLFLKMAQFGIIPTMKTGLRHIHIR